MRAAAPASTLAAVRAGAVGYLRKTASPTELHRAVRQVHGGEPFLPPEITEAGPVPLQPGDILLSSVYPETLVNSDTSTLSVTSRDVFIFRPDDVADYSFGGTFIKLINGQDLGIEIEGITLVEQSTTVGVGAGATILNPGDFLFTDRDSDSVIYRLQPGVLGDSAMNTGTVTVLVDGKDIGINQTIHGVELVESEVVVGDRTLTESERGSGQPPLR